MAPKEVQASCQPCCGIERRWARASAHSLSEACAMSGQSGVDAAQAVVAMYSNSMRIAKFVEKCIASIICSSRCLRGHRVSGLIFFSSDLPQAGPKKAGEEFAIGGTRPETLTSDPGLATTASSRRWIPTTRSGVPSTGHFHRLGRLDCSADHLTQ